MFILLFPITRAVLKQWSGDLMRPDNRQTFTMDIAVEIHSIGLTAQRGDMTGLQVLEQLTGTVLITRHPDDCSGFAALPGDQTSAIFFQRRTRCSMRAP